MISLQEVTRDNYLASNAVTIAQSKFEPHYRLKAIYKDHKVIGMLAFCHEDEPEDLELYWLFRLMLDKQYQGQGLAAQILNLVLQEIRALEGKRLQTMHKPSNRAANSAYRKFGFQEIGVLEDGDIHLEIQVS